MFIARWSWANLECAPPLEGPCGDHLLAGFGIGSSGSGSFADLGGLLAESLDSLERVLQGQCLRGRGKAKATRKRHLDEETREHVWLGRDAHRARGQKASIERKAWQP